MNYEAIVDSVYDEVRQSVAALARTALESKLITPEEAIFSAVYAELVHEHMIPTTTPIAFAGMVTRLCDEVGRRYENV